MSRAPLAVSDTFRDSIATTSLYPQNLVERFTYSATLKAYHARLQKVTRLLVTQESETEVAFRDYNEGASKFQRQKVRSLQELRQYLGVEQGPTAPTATNSPSRNGQSFVPTFSRKDPRCRFVFIYGNHSRARLRITEPMLKELLSYHQVMANYLDFVFLFGQSSGANDMRFSGFREQTYLRSPVTPKGLENLGRSGRGYEVSYNLKTVQLKNEDDPASWSVRQAGLYHAFDVSYGTTTWAITRALSNGKNDLKERIEELTGPAGRLEDRNFDKAEDCFRSSLSIHSIMIHWASESWRWYLQWLDEMVEEETKHVVYGTRDKASKGRKQYTAEDIQRVQRLEDSVNEVNLVVDGNIGVIIALSEYYSGIVANNDWPLPSSCAEYVHIFAKQAKNAVYDSKMQSARARALARHTGERKNLILQYVQAQTAENMEDLTKSTYYVGISAQKEAITMRIITVVTLIYLPATFVSTFFSTDVIKYQIQGNGGDGSPTSLSSNSSQSSYSPLAMYRWLQISLPLTAVTLVVAFAAYTWQKNRQKLKNDEVLGSFGLV